MLLPLRCSLFGSGAGAADYDGDGQLDLYMAGAAGQAGALLRGDGQGGFTLDATFKGAWPAGAEEMAVLWFDANGDSRLDLLVTAGGMEAPLDSELYGAKLFLNLPAGLDEQVGPERRLSTASAAAADVDKDGDLDLFLAGHLKPHQYMQTVPSALWLNEGGGKFVDATPAYLAAINQGGQITEAQFADFTGDGQPDLALARFFGSIEVWTGTGAGFVQAGAISDSGWWRSLGVGDFDNDGDLDLIAGNLGKTPSTRPRTARR